MTGKLASPCNDICQIHQATGWCEGCARTIAEITIWAKASDASRLAILERLPARRAQLLQAGIATAADRPIYPSTLLEKSD